MFLVAIQGTARTGADIHSTILHQRHEGPAAFNTSFDDTQPSHLAKIKKKFGNRSFSVAGPSAWNSLPDDIRSLPYLVILKRD